MERKGAGYFASGIQSGFKTNAGYTYPSLKQLYVPFFSFFRDIVFEVAQNVPSSDFI